jgi:hypothetical protein
MEQRSQSMPITIATLPVQDALFQLDAGLCVPVLAHVRFQLVQAGLRRPDAPVTVDSNPQQLAIPWPANATFVEVDPQF